MTQDDALLIEKGQNGEMAFSELYERFFPQIFGFISRRLSDRAEVEDLVSIIFMKVLEQLHRYDCQQGRFKPWLYAIATRTLIDYFRTHSHRKTQDIESAESIADPHNNPHDLAETSQHNTSVLNAIHSLPERHQRVLLLRYYSDLSIEELAETLGVNKNHVSVLIHRALSAFKLTYERHV